MSALSNNPITVIKKKQQQLWGIALKENTQHWGGNTSCKATSHNWVVDSFPIIAHPYMFYSRLVYVSNCRTVQ